MPSHFDPLAFANIHGIRVVERPFARVQRAWDATDRTILISSFLPDTMRRGSLGHALGHAVLGHDSCANITCSPAGMLQAREFSADKWAARQMLDPERLRRSPYTHLCQIAESLDVLPSQVIAYQLEYGTEVLPHDPHYQHCFSITREAPSRSLPPPIDVPGGVDQPRIAGVHHPAIR